MQSRAHDKRAHASQELRLSRSNRWEMKAARIETPEEWLFGYAARVCDGCTREIEQRNQGLQRCRWEYGIGHDA